MTAAMRGKAKTPFKQIAVMHGPATLMGRFFLKAEDAVRQRGLTLSFASMDDLLALNQCNRDTWLPLFPLFDPTVNDLTHRNAFCVLGHNQVGEPVAAQAGRLYEWGDTNLCNEAASLRMFYDAPNRSKNPNERCRVTAVAAKGVTGSVVFSGAAWYRRDYRGRQLVEILPRLSRAYAYMHWKSDLTITMMTEPVVRSGVFPKNGYRNIEWEILMENSRLGDLRLSLQWSKTEEMIEDLAWFVDSFDVSVGLGAVARRA
jgi:hypothetical protein